MGVRWPNRNRWFSQRTNPPFMVGIFHGYVSHNQMVMNMATDLGCKYGSWIMVLPVEKSSLVGSQLKWQRHFQKGSQGIETNNLGWIKRIKRNLENGITTREGREKMSRQNRRAQGRQEGGGGKKWLEQAQLDMSCGIRVHDWSGERFTTKKHSETTLGKQTSSTHWLIFFAARACSASVRLCAVVCLSHPWKFSAATHVHHTRYSTNVVIPIFRVSYHLRVVGIYPSNKLVIWGMVKKLKVTNHITVTLRLLEHRQSKCVSFTLWKPMAQWRFGQAATGDVADRAWMSDSSMLDAVWHGQNMPQAPKIPKQRVHKAKENYKIYKSAALISSQWNQDKSSVLKPVVNRYYQLEIGDSSGQFHCWITEWQILDTLW